MIYMKQKKIIKRVKRLQPGHLRTARRQEQRVAFMGIVVPEQNKLVSTRLRVFSDLRSGEIQGDTGRRIVDHIKRLSKVGASRQVVQMAISGITRELLNATVEQSQRDVLLVPVLRAGVAMWSVANEFFGFPETSFVWGKKEKGTDRASILWPKRNVMDDRHVLIFDPIIATGDTLVQVSESIVDTMQGASSFTVFSCYAAPEGVQAVLDKTRNINLVVGCMAETVDENGYLLPLTHGDMGDKLFGPVTEM